MEGESGGRRRPVAGGKGKAPGPPPPPPSEDEPNGGHRRGHRRRRRRIRPRAHPVAIALAGMIAAAVYLLFAEALGVPPPLAASWFFVAFVMWIMSLNVLYYSMN
ncbi:hypothetical protein BS78_10G226500 [Paspalum vaginatum]|nr:hypothetical protein BS78_10G226500 [Paspalum vaginatum]